MNKFLKYALLGSITCVLLAGLYFLYEKTFSLDWTQRETTAALLAELRKIDGTWNAEVLRSKNGVSRDYDAVTAPQSTALDVLDRVGEQGLGRFDHRLQEAQRVLRETIVTKSDLVDRFKRESAIMRNSLRYIPAATEELKSKLRDAAAAAPQKRAQLEAMTAAADQILADASRLEGSNDRAQARRLDIAVSRLTVNRAEYPPAVLESFDNFARHAVQIATQKEREIDTLDSLARVPLLDYTDALDKEARKAFDHADAERNAYRTALYGYAGVLLVLLAFLGVRMFWRRGGKPAAPSRTGATRLQHATRA